MQKVDKKTKNIIAKGVKASEFNIREGIITYKNYSLKSPLIRKLPWRIYSKVDHLFILVNNDIKKTVSFLSQ